MPRESFEARYGNLARICEFVSVNAKRAGLSDGAAYEVELATNEAFTNIIEHGYGGDSDNRVDCSIEADDGGVTVILTDWSAPFDPAGVPEANFEVPLEQLNLRGAGLRLIRRSMDAVEFQPLPGRGNRLTMRKKR